MIREKNDKDKAEKKKIWRKLCVFIIKERNLFVVKK